MKAQERNEDRISKALQALYNWQYTVAMSMAPRTLESRYETLYNAMIDHSESDLINPADYRELEVMLDAIYDAAHARGLVRDE